MRNRLEFSGLGMPKPGSGGLAGASRALWQLNGFDDVQSADHSDTMKRC